MLHANLEKKLPQNLDAEINTTAPPSAHPKLSPYKSSILRHLNLTYLTTSEDVFMFSSLYNEED